MVGQNKVGVDTSSTSPRFIIRISNAIWFISISLLKFTGLKQKLNESIELILEVQLNVPHLLYYLLIQMLPLPLLLIDALIKVTDRITSTRVYEYLE
jgi:hypothetical protein